MKVWKRVLKRQSGQVLPMALVLMLLGGLVIVPTLSLATTNLRATTAVDQHTRELYAADAGIEDALWYLQSDARYEMINPTHQSSVSYTITGSDNVNSRDVKVNINTAWVLQGIKNVPGVPITIPDTEPTVGSTQYANNNWTVLGAISVDNTHNYVAVISTNLTSPGNVGHIGVWMPYGFTYVNNSVRINGVPIGGPGTNYQYVKNPTSQADFRGGKVYIWNYYDTTAFKTLSDIEPPPSGQGVTPGSKWPPSIMLSFDYTVTPFREARGFFPWIMLQTNNGIAWDTAAGYYRVQSASYIPATPTDNTTVEAYVPRGIRRWVSGSSGSSSAMKGDYIAIGNTLMTECWNYDSKKGVYSVGPPCVRTCEYGRCLNKLYTESSATVNPNFGPSDAKIEKAYLYWTAMRNASGADTQVKLKVNGTLVGSDGWVTADKYYTVSVTSGYYQYACKVDVTDKVKAITTTLRGTTFTVGDVAATPASACNSGTTYQVANAGWSMILIYSTQDPNAQVHQIYVYDRLTYLSGSYSSEFTILGFEMPSQNRDVKVGYFLTEGDENYYNDYFEFQPQNSFNYVYLGHSCTYPSTTCKNPWNNVFNSYSSIDGFTASDLQQYPTPEPGEISGIDLDVYFQDKNNNSLASLVQGGDTQAKLRIRASRASQSSSTDYVDLVYVVLSVTSTAVPVGEEFNVGGMTYTVK